MVTIKRVMTLNFSGYTRTTVGASTSTDEPMLASISKTFLHTPEPSTPVLGMSGGGRRLSNTTRATTGGSTVTSTVCAAAAAAQLMRPAAAIGRQFRRSETRLKHFSSAAG